MSITFILVDSNKVIGLNDASFESLICELSKLGLAQTEKSDYDIYIAINHNKNIYNQMNQPLKIAKKVLIRLEPYSVFPAQYSSKIESKYDIVISPGSVNDFKNSSYFIGFPHSIQKNPANPTFKNKPSFEAFIKMNSKKLESNWSNRNLLCTMVAANKVSITSNSNYKLRRQLASKFDTDNLQIFGPLWNDPLIDKLVHRAKTLKFNFNYGLTFNLIEVYGNLFRKYPHAKGIIEDKYSVLFNSKFSLVVENSMEYVSEKIFDVLVSKSIPVYFGPSLTSVGLPEEIAIKGELLQSFNLEFLTELDFNEVIKYLDAGEKFMNSYIYLSTWKSESVYKSIANRIVSELIR